MSIDPYVEDTSGDGLADAEQVNLWWEFNETDSGQWKLEAELLEADAHPAMVDTANNGLTDYEEMVVWETNPLLKDTSGDGFIDSVDPHPTEVTRPPNVQVTSPRLQIETDEFGNTVIREFHGTPGEFDNNIIEPDFNNHVRIQIASDTELDSVEVNALYSPAVGDWIEEPYWTTDHEKYLRQVILAQPEQQRYGYIADVFLHQHGWLDEPPERYWVNVTTTGGHGYNIEIDPNSTTAVDRAKARLESTKVTPILAGATMAASTTQIGTSAGAAVVGAKMAPAAGLLLVGGYAALYSDFNQPASSYSADHIVDEQRYTVPASEFAQTYEPYETPARIGTVKLPSGAVYEAPEEFGDGYDRGFGKEYIVQLPGITEGNVEDGLGEVLRNPSAIEQDGPYQIVIGDNPFGEGELALRLLHDQNALLVISAGQLVEDPTGHKVQIDPTDRHPVDRPGHADNWGQIRDAVQNPNQIWINDVDHGSATGLERHYIAEINGEWLVVRTYWEGTMWTVSTAPKYGTKSQIEQYIDERDLDDKVYGDEL